MALLPPRLDVRSKKDNRWMNSLQKHIQQELVIFFFLNLLFKFQNSLKSTKNLKVYMKFDIDFNQFKIFKKPGDLSISYRTAFVSTTNINNNKICQMLCNYFPWQEAPEAGPIFIRPVILWSLNCQKQIMKYYGRRATMPLVDLWRY